MSQKAFVGQYKKYPMFSDGFDEFDESRETVRELVDEYEDAEKESYLDWGVNEMKEQ